jgi:hypothetical protein
LNNSNLGDQNAMKFKTDTGVEIDKSPVKEVVKISVSIG